MAAIIILSSVIALVGVVLGAYVRICAAIRREDRIAGSLRFDAPSHSARSARALVGVGSRWE